MVTTNKLTMRAFSLFAVTLLMWFANTTSALAQEPDTGGMVFTEITTATDSLVNATKDTQQVVKAVAPVASSAAVEAAPQSLWGIFIAGFLGGFAAFLMPCVYPMLPLTVSFFLKRGGSKVQAIGQSAIYGLSIVVIYVGLGVFITLLFGPAALNGLATNGIFNFCFFLLLIVFAISLLGAFEIVLPTSLTNKLDEKSDSKGLLGIFFMAATLVVVSFSCTGPAIGFVLVNIVNGDIMAPVVVMFGFSLAIALPFTLFAAFPSALKSLPKSGGWLNSVKVMLGFLEIVLSLKFLSNVDLAYHWNIIDREIVLSIWIAVSMLAGLYLIGKIRLKHDSPLEYLSVLRTFIAIGVFAFTAYLIPGLWGAPLKAISAQLPPLSTQDFDISQGTAAAPAVVNASLSIKEKKYEELFARLPKVKGLDEWYDFEQAKAVAREVKKPILIDFTGWNCVNCRQMEQNVFPHPEVLKRLQNEFVMLQLVIDDKTDLPEAEQFTSPVTKKRITTLGGKWLDFEIKSYNSNAQPFYVIVDETGQTLVPPQGAIDITEFVKYLDSGISAYNTLQAAKK